MADVHMIYDDLYTYLKKKNDCPVVSQCVEDNFFIQEFTSFMVKLLRNPDNYRKYP